MGIEHAFVQEWRNTHQCRVVDASKTQELFDYLNNLPWGTSGLNWRNIPNVAIPFGEGDPQPQWTTQFTDTPLGRHEFIMVAYAPQREALVGSREEVLADLDLLYSGSPGARYFCGADVHHEALTLTVADFAEFSDEGVRVHLPTSHSD
ncbi:hypothetical protein ABZ471_22145 [Streptomyces sp. NPDC005728]|uniref:hypothetical protein n=1 Tax=Streptomyces sp. NPDC005728 TaxID=3157054 RepID=UPI00340AFA09